MNYETQQWRDVLLSGLYSRKYHSNRRNLNSLNFFTFLDIFSNSKFYFDFKLKLSFVVKLCVLIVQRSHCNIIMLIIIIIIIIIMMNIKLIFSCGSDECFLHFFLICQW
jgi:hypothetical protein